MVKDGADEHGRLLSRRRRWSHPISPKGSPMREKIQTAKIVRCSSCHSVIGGEKVCSCGQATPNMTFAERTEYELQQYRAYKARVVASV
jgi:hypothetical protein